MTVKGMAEDFYQSHPHSIIYPTLLTCIFGHPLTDTLTREEIFNYRIKMINQRNCVDL